MSNLSDDFLSAKLETQFDYVHGIYGRMIAWEEYDRHSEYVEETIYLSQKYSKEILKAKASEIYSRLLWHVDHEDAGSIKERYMSELECLSHIKRYGTFPEVEFKDPELAFLYPIYEKAIALRDLIRCANRLNQPATLLDDEEKKYLESYMFTMKDLNRLKSKEVRFLETMILLPQIESHISEDVRQFLAPQTEEKAILRRMREIPFVSATPIDKKPDIAKLINMIISPDSANHIEHKSQVRKIEVPVNKPGKPLEKRTRSGIPNPEEWPEMEEVD